MDFAFKSFTYLGISHNKTGLHFGVSPIDMFMLWILMHNTVHMWNFIKKVHMFYFTFKPTFCIYDLNVHVLTFQMQKSTFLEFLCTKRCTFWSVLINVRENVDLTKNEFIHWLHGSVCETDQQELNKWGKLSISLMIFYIQPNILHPCTLQL